MRPILSRQLITILLLAAAAVTGSTFATTTNPMNAPDELAWNLFLQVNADAKSAGNNSALFETWASDHDTFQAKPGPFPSKATPLHLKVPALKSVMDSLPGAHDGFQTQVVPGATHDSPSEETRRNKPAYDFIVANRLYIVSGLKAASNTTISFPPESIEVKANWYPVADEKDPSKSGIPGYSGKPADAAKVYHVNTASDGKQYALVSMHVISKLVPNWTWATFEHKNNPERCDILGCNDPFGAKPAYVPPHQTPGTGYGDCGKTPALQALFAKAKVDPAFQNYCLKGSQTDFTTATGEAVRLGNSVTESGFVNQSSCMTCHSRAAFNTAGKATSNAGFDPATGLAPLGSPNPNWFSVSSSHNPPYYPIVINQSDLTRLATAADFVWSIPFCAVDDTTSPPKVSHCDDK